MNMPGIEGMTEEQIQQCLAGLRNGDKDARTLIFLYLADEFRPLAHRLLRGKFVRIGQHAETDDILNTTLTRLIPYLEKTEAEFASSKGRFQALTASVLRHTLLDLARKHFGSLQAQPIGDRLEAIHPRLQVSSGLNDWRERLRVHDLIERLPTSERAAIELALYKGLGTNEIAERLDVHPGTISKRLMSAKERLGRMLKADDRAAEGKTRNSG